MWVRLMKNKPKSLNSSLDCPFKIIYARHQENQLSLIEKQRRGWEGAREKAEEMAQIFDSLIITSKSRPTFTTS